MNGPRILIVDDEERYRTTLTKRILERQLDATSVGSGQEALAELKRKLYDVVVLDVKMPGLDGIETLKEIKKTTPNVEVILLTGHASVDSAVDGMRLGAFDYLLKPCELEILLEKINGAFGIKMSRDQRMRQAEIRSLIDRKPS
ncbi:MAG: response regulator [Desulfobacterales bacterium]|nr:response regulator [Desulfobacterales bacterium]